MEKIGIVILNYNGTEETITLIDSINDCERSIEPIFIIVDNDSDERNRRMLETYARSNGYEFLDEDLHTIEQGGADNRFYIQADKNHGYAKGNNYGLILASKLGIKYSLVSNNDILFKEAILMKMADVLAAEPKIAVIGPEVVDGSGKKQGPYRKPNLLTRFAYPFAYPLLVPIRVFNKKLHDRMFIEPMSCKESCLPYRIMGCFMLMKTEVIREVGYFDENTFLYAEEMILSEKLQKLNYSTMYYPECRIIHNHGVTTDRIFGNRKKKDINLASLVYYFRTYRGYNRMQILMIKLGRNTFFHIWRPIIHLFKRLTSQIR